MLNFKRHFEMHFQAESIVLYEEANGRYYRKKWQDIYNVGAIKRIHYNTTYVKNYLIIDIDNDNIFKYKENNLPEPNFILKNKFKQGGHLFYVLEKPIFSNNQKELDKWRILQKEYTRIAGGDPLNKGYVGKFFNNTEDFDYIKGYDYYHNVDFLLNKIQFKTANNQAYNRKINYYEPKKQEKNN